MKIFQTRIYPENDISTKSYIQKEYIYQNNISKKRYIQKKIYPKKIHLTILKIIFVSLSSMSKSQSSTNKITPNFHSTRPLKFVFTHENFSDFHDFLTTRGFGKEIRRKFFSRKNKNKFASIDYQQFGRLRYNVIYY